MVRTRLCNWLALIGIIITHNAWAQTRPAPNKSAAHKPPLATAPGGCLDVVSLRQAKPARGLVFQQQAESLLMIVERTLFQQDNPAWYARAAEQERGQAKQAWTELLQRIDQRLQTKVDEIPMLRLLERDKQRGTEELAKLNAEPTRTLETPFMWLELSARDYSSVKRASPESLRIAVWAWSEGLEQVSSRPCDELQRELQAEKIDTRQAPPDLSHLLAPRPQTENQWAARLAWVEHALVGGLEFQGSGDRFVRTDSGAAAPDLASLIQQAIGGNVDALLDDLDPARRSLRKSNSADWTLISAPQAEMLQRSAYRVTRVRPDPNGQAATVELAFVVNLPRRGWTPVWRAQHTTAAAQVPADAQRQIADDPQVKLALSLLSALGAGGEAQVQQALSVGAATAEAQREVQQQARQFQDRLTARLDGPPLADP